MGRHYLSLWRKRGYKLSLIVSVLVGISIILTLTISIWAVYETEQTSFTERTLELNRINSDRLAATTSSLFKSMQHSLSLTAQQIVNRVSDQVDIQYHLDLVTSGLKIFNSTFFMNVSGVVVSVSPLNLGLVGTTLNSPQSKQALAAQKPFISEPYKAITGNLIILVSEPVFTPQGDYLGIVAGTIYLQENNVFKDIFEKDNKSGNGSYSYVLDRTGTLLYHPDAGRIGEKDNKNAMLQKIKQGETDGQSVLMNAKGIAMLTGYTIVPENGWEILTQTSAAEIVAQSQKVIRKIVVFALPFIILLLLIAWWMSARIAAPLKNLALYARDFSAGAKLNKPLPTIRHWNYEASELNRAILKAVSKLQQKVEHFTLESQTDALTGLMNRRSLDDYLELWMAQKTNFSIILLDLDYFKNVNDSYGHLMGDEVLKFLARVMIKELRPEDVCCRYGGEEFVILLPRLNLDLAYKVAERIRLQMELSASPLGIPVTLSLGIAAFPETADEPTLLFERVDQALYQAKQNGRNQTVIYA
jgi:diguanylate cyclase (GGDEF)-like protein